MNKFHSITPRMMLAVALSIGAVLVPHRSSTDQAPGAYSDIVIVQNGDHKAEKFEDIKLHGKG